MNKQTDDKAQIKIDINNYHEERREKLYAFIRDRIEWVKREKKPFKFINLNAYERRKVHLYVQEYADDLVYTESKGE